MIELAGNVAAYKLGLLDRPGGDPLGQRGLPPTRASLDALMNGLCDRLRAAGAAGIRGRQLAEEMQLESTRALRLLVAYARVHHHRHEIVGLPGAGYCWGESRPGIYATTITQCQRRARCYFFIAALHKRQGTAMAAAQMIFEFMEQDIPAARRYNDDLAALVAAEGVTVADFLDAFISSLAASDEGRATLQRVGEKFGDVLLPREIIASAVAKLDEVRTILSRPPVAPVKIEG